MFDNQMAEKKRIEDGAMALQRKMNQVHERRLFVADRSHISRGLGLLPGVVHVVQ